MNIKELLERVNYQFGSGGKFQWDCYGPDAFFIDFQTVDFTPCGGAIINSTGRVFEAHIEVPGEPICYKWVDPVFVQPYVEEAKRRNIDPNNAWDDVRYTDLDLEEDFLEKFDAIIHNRDFDRRILVPMDLSKEQLHQLFTLAHEADMSLNDFVAFILRRKIEQLKNPKKKEKKKYKEKYGW
jgi:hypothetical protein